MFVDGENEIMQFAVGCAGGFKHGAKKWSRVGRWFSAERAINAPFPSIHTDMRSLLFSDINWLRWGSRAAMDANWKQFLFLYFSRKMCANRCSDRFASWLETKTRALRVSLCRLSLAEWLRLSFSTSTVYQKQRHNFFLLIIANCKAYKCRSSLDFASYLPAHREPKKGKMCHA